MGGPKNGETRIAYLERRIREDHHTMNHAIGDGVRARARKKLPELYRELQEAKAKGSTFKPSGRKHHLKAQGV